MTGFYGDNVRGGRGLKGDRKIIGLVWRPHSYATLHCHRLNHSTNTDQSFPGYKAQSPKRWLNCPWAPWSKLEVELLEQINNTNLDRIMATKLARNNTKSDPI